MLLAIIFLYEWLRSPIGNDVYPIYIYISFHEDCAAGGHERISLGVVSSMHLPSLRPLSSSLSRGGYYRYYSGLCSGQCTFLLYISELGNGNRLLGQVGDLECTDT